MNAAVLRSPVFWFRVVSLAVVVSLAFGVARLTWRLVGWDDGRTQVWTPAALPPVAGAGGGDLASILAWAPFGGGLATASSDGLPISNLGLVLKGIVYATGGGSTVLIASGEGPVQIFSEGQTPIGNAVIELIEEDRVVVNVGGRREALLLPTPTGVAPGAAPSTAPFGAGPAAASAQPAPAAAPGTSPEAQAALASSSPIATAAAASAAARPAPPAPAPQTPAAAVSSLGVSASPQGYVIGDDSAPQLLRAGLRPGDVVKSLNGQALGDPQGDQQIIQRAAAGGRARVEVVRDGRTLTLTVPLR